MGRHITTMGSSIYDILKRKRINDDPTFSEIICTVDTLMFSKHDKHLTKHYAYLEKNHTHMVVSSMRGNASF